MGSAIPKQYLRFHGKTVIEHCLDRLLEQPEIVGAVLVLDAADDHWKELGYESDKPLMIVAGGSERQHSVYSGLTALQYRLCGDDCLALVHDAVRPLVSVRDIRRVIAAARQHAAGAILAAPVTDTLKLENPPGKIAETLPRNGLWRALTPQVFDLQLLLQAHKRLTYEQRRVTDDAEAMELAGYAPRLVSGSGINFKITMPEDLALAESLWLDQHNQQDDE
jgi:2-C-methyl-D-erythritol 4-phosphate cytidylyltransferase